MEGVGTKRTTGPSRRSALVVVWAVCAVILASTLPAPDAGAAKAIAVKAGGPTPTVSALEMRMGTPAPVTGSAMVSDLSPPLRNITPARNVVRPVLPEVPSIRRGSGVPTASQLADRGPILQPAVGQNMPAATTFAGISQKDNRSLGYTAEPPDTNGDVGGNFYVQWVNVTLAIYKKSGGAPIYGPVPGNTPWKGFPGACASSNDGDPVVVYDSLAHRWVLSQFALPSYPKPPFYECVAVSKTLDPTGKWFRYQFKFTSGGRNFFNDYTKLSVWPDGYYLSFNEFNGNTFVGQGAVALDRTRMLAGNPSPKFVYFDEGTKKGLGGMLPSTLEGTSPPPPGTPDYYVQFDDDAFGYPRDQLEIWGFGVDWGAPKSSTFSKVTTLATQPFDSLLCGGAPTCIPQPGTTQRLDPLSDRIMYRLQYLNLGSTQTLVTDQTVNIAPGSGSRAGVRWYELQNGGGGWSIAQQGTLDPGGTDSAWMASAALDTSGDLAVGYSVSGSSTQPSVEYSGRLASDPANTLGQGQTVMQAGGGHETENNGRWGDYTSMSLDPSDGCTFWYTNEYYARTSPSGWATVIGHFKYPSCTSIPDKTPPTGVAITKPTKPFMSGKRISVGWTATDPGSGVASYDVSYRKAPYTTGTFGSETPWRTGTATTGARLSGVAGQTYCFRVTAEDGAGNVSAPSPERCAATPVDDRALTPSGGWTRHRGRGSFARTYSQTFRKGSTLTLSGVEADRLAVMIEKCPGCGRLQVLWNGTVEKTIGLGSPVVRKRKIVPVAALGSVQAGSLTLRVVSSGKRVIVDGVGIAEA